MTHFYFHLRTCDGLDHDEIGLELPHVEAAYAEAWKTIPGLSAELLRQRRNPMDYAFVITDAAGREVMDVPFSEMAKPRRKPVIVAPTTGIDHTRTLVTELDDLTAAMQANIGTTLAGLKGGSAPGE